MVEGRDDAQVESLARTVAHELALVGKGDRDALFALAVLLKDPDAFVRREAVVAMSKAGDSFHIPQIEALLIDRQEAVRAEAVRAVAALDHAPQHHDRHARCAAMIADIKRHQGREDLTAQREPPRRPP